MEKIKEATPCFGAYSSQAASPLHLQPLTIPGLWDSADIQGLLWVSVDALCLSRQIKWAGTLYSAKHYERSKNDLDRPICFVFTSSWTRV